MTTVVAYAEAVSASSTGYTNTSNALGDTTSTYASPSEGGLLRARIDDAPFSVLTGNTIDEVRVSVEVSDAVFTNTVDLLINDTDTSGSIDSATVSVPSTSKQWVQFTASPAPSIAQLQSNVWATISDTASLCRVHRMRVEVDYSLGTETFTVATTSATADSSPSPDWTEQFTAAITEAAADSSPSVLLLLDGEFFVSPTNVTSDVPSVTWLPGTVTWQVGETTAEASSLTVAFLPISPPEPPPVPWQTLLASDAWATAVGARQRTTGCRVDLIDDSGGVVASLGQDSTLGGVVSGSVTCNGDRAVRWSCDLTLAEPDLVPTTVTDLLGPLSRLRARVWWLIRLPDETWGEVPVGTYLLSEPSVTDTPDTFTITVTGDDAVRQLRQARWTEALDVAGQPVDLAMRAVLQNRAPWLPTQITPVDRDMPDGYEIGDLGGDPWDTIRDIAAAGNYETFVDRLGTFVARPDRARTSTRQVGWVEGDTCAMSSVQRILTTDQLLNEYTVMSNDPDVEPVSWTARDDDPTSPTWVGHGRIWSDVYSSDTMTTVDQCKEFAESVIRRRRARVERLELVARGRPDLDPGDLVEVRRQRSQVTGLWEVQGWSLALGPNSGMRVTLSERRSPWLS